MKKKEAMKLKVGDVLEWSKSGNRITIECIREITEHEKHFKASNGIWYTANSFNTIRKINN